MIKSVLMVFVALLPVALTANDGIKVGDTAPDFEVQGLDKASVKLSEGFGDDRGATVLLFSRANW